jgi:hypothetical protein
MTTLSEIEAAAAALTMEQQQELLVYLASRLRSQQSAPAPREFSVDQMNAWIAEDESDMRGLNEQS